MKKKKKILFLYNYIWKKFKHQLIQEDLKLLNYYLLIN